MDIKITPKKLTGTVSVPQSKSHCHRLLIAARLAGNMDAVDPERPSLDILATKKALETLSCEAPRIDCGESGSTLRFMLPVTMALKNHAEFSGRGQLPNRPLSPLWEQMEEHGCDLVRGENGLICSADGPLHGGDFFLPGDISSQYVTGLLFALPLTEEGGIIHLTSPLQSKNYVDMTLEVLKDFGIYVSLDKSSFAVEGRQKYILPEADAAAELIPERDWSAAAFWISADALGSNIDCPGLDTDSSQSDKEIVRLAPMICGTPGGTSIDATHIPDLVPVLAALMAASPGVHRITGAARLRIKESDRLAAMKNNLDAVGGDVTETEDGLLIRGSKDLAGGVTRGYGDHRIVMAMAVAACACRGPVIIEGADAVSKSYPGFFEDYRALGGIADEISIRK